MMDKVILPTEIKNHIVNNSELSNFQRLDSHWKLKFHGFLELVNRNSMNIVRSVKFDEKCGILLFTYSGSLILISPLNDNSRWLEYSGLNRISDKPKFISEDNIKILKDINIHQVVYFDASKIKNTSPIYKIAVY